MITLALDASTSVGTVALFRETELAAAGEKAMKSRESETLMPLAVEVMERAGCSIADVERIACGAGPGSFTSLRIAASIAKGLVVGRDVPLYALSSLALVVAANTTDQPDRFLAVLDALRGDMYAQLVLVDGDGSVRTEGAHVVVPAPELPTLAARLGARIVGPEQDPAWQPHARGARRLFHQMEAAGPVDVGNWEPEYGRLAEAQNRWEAAHGRKLGV